MRCGRTGLVIGLADGGIPVWEILRGWNFMGNALTTRKYPEPGAGVLWVDSGGFQAMRRGVGLSVERVAEAFRDIEAVYYIMLDEPPPHGIGGWESARRNLALFEELYARLEDRTIVPVVHHYDIGALEWLIDKYLGYGARILALGGSVPGLLNRAKRKAATLLYIAITRRLWPHHLHVLGAGSPVMRCLLSMIGADTADTATWRAKAAYGKIIIPGAGERYVGKRRIRYGPLYARRDELELLERFLRRTGFPLIDGPGSLESLLATFRGRALVNAWILAHSEPSPGRGYRWMLKLAAEAASRGLEDLVKMHEVAVRGVEQG